MYLNQTTTNRDQPMKSTKSILLFTAISFLLFLHTACEKDEQDNMQAPAVVTLAVTEITASKTIKVLQLTAQDPEFTSQNLPICNPTRYITFGPMQATAKAPPMAINYN